MNSCGGKPGPYHILRDRPDPHRANALRDVGETDVQNDALSGSSGGGGFGLGFTSAFISVYVGGFLIDDADGFVENVIGKIVEDFPKGLVNGGCTNSVFGLFRAKAEQTMSENVVSPGDLQRQVRDALKGMPV